MIILSGSFLYMHTPPYVRPLLQNKNNVYDLLTASLEDKALTK